jgi:hypothetical protein
MIPQQGALARLVSQTGIPVASAKRRSESVASA